MTKISSASENQYLLALETALAPCQMSLFVLPQALMQAVTDEDNFLAHHTLSQLLQDPQLAPRVLTRVYQKGGDHTLSELREVFNQFDAPLQVMDLQHMAFGQGPGSFVGTRIACATTLGFKTVNQAMNVLALDSTQMLAEHFKVAQRVHPELLPANAKIFVALDALMSEVYGGVFALGAAMQPTTQVLQPSRLFNLEELAALVRFALYPEQHGELLAQHPFLAQIGLEQGDTLYLAGNGFKSYLAKMQDKQLLAARVTLEQVLATSQVIVAPLQQVLAQLDPTGHTSSSYNQEFLEVGIIPLQLEALLAGIAQGNFLAPVDCVPNYVRNNVTY